MKDLISLCIDTSTEYAIIGLYRDQEWIDTVHALHANNLSKILLPSIQSLLAKHTLSPGNLHSIALGIGPGSYTGTRVGAAVAKSLGFALQIPLLPFPSPLAFIPPSVDGDFIAVIPSKAGPCFVLHGNLTSRGITAVDTFFLSPEELTLHLKNSSRTLISMELNLRALLPFLSTIHPIRAEDVMLTYLHHPTPAK